MTVTLQITAKLNQSKVQDLSAFLEANLPNTRGAKGCRLVSVFFDDNKETILINEEWLTQADHQAYVQKITENGVMNLLLAFFDGEPSICYYNKTTL